MRFKIHSWLTVPFVGALLLCASCSQEAKQPLPADTLAVIGERVITQRDLDAEAALRVENGLETLSPVELLDRMMIRESMLIRARLQGLEKDPDIKRELEQILVSQLREKELTALYDAIAVSEDELKKAYDENIDRFSKPALNRIAMLYLKKDKNASAEKIDALRARMRDARVAANQLEKGSRGFGALSVSFSDDVVSRYRGGDLGWVSGTRPPSQIPEVVFFQTLELSIGQLGDLIETEQGIYLTMRTDERPATVKGFEQVRATLEKQLLSEKRASVEQDYYRDCLQAANVQLNEENLARLEDQNEMSAPQAALQSALHVEF